MDTPFPLRERTHTPARATQRRDAAENHGSILNAARRVLATDPNASIDTIARSAGLSRRALYGHFADRTELVTAVIAAGAAHFNHIATSIQATSPREALAMLAEALWKHAEHMTAVASLALRDDWVHHTAAALEPLRQRVLEICEDGARTGDLRGDLPPACTARLVEEAARGALLSLGNTEAPATDFPQRAVLSAAGLSWREADDLIRSQPRHLDSEEDAA